MTNLEALVSVSQTLLQVRGEWCVNGIDATLSRDIRNIVADVSKMLRWENGSDEAIADAVEELEQRAIAGERPQPFDGIADVTLREPTERPFKHVHNWCPTISDLIDRCSVCGEERA
jgi:hypothetical protein